MTTLEPLTLPQPRCETWRVCGSHAPPINWPTEISIEPHIVTISTGNEPETAAVLIEAADDIQQYSLNILA